MYLNKIFKRYFAFVMAVSAFAMGMQYSPDMNNYMSDSYVSVINSVDLLLEDEVKTKNFTIVAEDVSILSKGVENYIKSGQKEVTILDLEFEGKSYILDSFRLKIEGGQVAKKIAVYDGGTGEEIAEGREKDGYWKFDMLDFSGKKLVIKASLNKNVFPGERLRAQIENPSDIIFGSGFKKAEFPLMGNYLSIVGK